MTPPSPREFTVEHVRVVIPPELALHTSLVLVSGMFPKVSATPLDAVLNWFGTNLYPATAPADDTVQSRLGDIETARHFTRELTGTGDAAVLDLAYVTHAAAVRARRGRLGTAVCGFATMSMVGTNARASIGLRTIGSSAHQLRVAYQALQAATPRATLDAVSRAIYPHTPPVPRSGEVAAMPLSHLIDDRDGVADTAFSTINNVNGAVYTADDNSIWTLMPRAAGVDFNHDAHIAAIASTPHYRVFVADDESLPEPVGWRRWPFGRSR